MQKGEEHTAESIEPIANVQMAGGKEFVMSQVGKAQTSLARKRKHHLRKEQLSQGVLKRLLQTLGRLTYDEVCACSFVLHYSSFSFACVCM
jgi:hypothetical protein